MVYKHAYLDTLVLLHPAFMVSVVKMPLKGEVGGRTLNIIMEIRLLIMENHGKIMELCFKFLWEPCVKGIMGENY